MFLLSENTVASQIDLKTGAATSGKTIIEGEQSNIDLVWFSKPTKFNLADGKTIRSDCNGPQEVSESTTPSAVQKRDGAR